MKNLLLTFLFSICALSLLAQNNRPEHLYIIGTLNADGSDDLVGQEFTTEDNNIYTCNGVRVYKQSESAVGPDIYITENPNASQSDQSVPGDLRASCHSQNRPVQFPARLHGH